MHQNLFLFLKVFNFNQDDVCKCYEKVIATQDNHDHFKFPNKHSSGKTYYLLDSVQGHTTPTSALVHLLEVTSRINLE